MNVNEFITAINSGAMDERFSKLYDTAELDTQKARYTALLKEFARLYGECRDVRLFSVAGRSEISGNHTDHNRGCVLAASINLDIIAVAAKNGENIIRLKSEGFDEDKVDISVLKADEKEYFTSKALIAGVCDGFVKNGHEIGGFDAVTTSNVLKGSGLSSSAAFEAMVGNIESHLYNGDGVDNVEIAKIAQYSENVFFGKPCGLMDQTACAVGGFIAIDFADKDNPVIEKMPFDLSAEGYYLCITNTGGNHANLNADYASVPAEMKAVASFFGKDVLRGLEITDIISNAKELREKFGDRAILRAIHFINENNRVNVQKNALKEGNLSAFLDGVTASGNSSFKFLQNVYTTQNVTEQGLSLALAISENVLSSCNRKWAVRVHGGGFAGTIQAFVPNECVEEYKKTMDGVFGTGACMPLKVRAYGATEI